MTTPDTFGTLHSGDVVQGADGESWGVEAVEREPQFAVTLVRHGRRVRGFPPAGMPVTVLSRADVSAEIAAVDVLLAGGLDVDLVREEWQP